LNIFIEDGVDVKEKDHTNISFEYYTDKSSVYRRCLIMISF